MFRDWPGLALPGTAGSRWCECCARPGGGFRVTPMRRLISDMTHVHAVWTGRMSCSVCLRFHDKTCVIKRDILGACRHIYAPEWIWCHRIYLCPHPWRWNQQPLIKTLSKAKCSHQSKHPARAAHPSALCPYMACVHVPGGRARFASCLCFRLTPFFPDLQYFLFCSHKTCSGMM